MVKYENKVRLTDLAIELKVTNSALLQHLKNKSGLGEGAEKCCYGHRTDDYMLEVSSILNFLNFLKTKAKKIKIDDIIRVETELKQ